MLPNRELKEGQRYLRVYCDGGNPSVIIEVTEIMPGYDSAKAKVVQQLRTSSNIEHDDWDYSDTSWWILGRGSDVKYIYLEGQDAPQ